ncbi:microtubule-associated protein (YTM1 homologue), putative [Theileria annulata]|uniref:Microtubule-associated protein (YTM1 homologue), putative n=1 Tax=Theileria annulata TaxID=5874 RepID=Q4U8N5_THEAN|nr:microtubule-associated protein (YTM1 homologue), putative [Theileria annulata]CAI76818.1 microtubule-associated protein (YTM1 homologue), putative [Theileria annulata]|eukprot:XP_953443.1 microtubule-associated protein (YTM1 homologue), putative [Theileria annulata]
MTVEEIYAKFVNGSDEKYDLEDNNFLISTSMDRNSLSKMINELLNLENHVSFDIIINNNRLRTTISEVLEEQNIQSETIIEVLYVLTISEPSENNVDNLNDWISGLSHDVCSDISAVCCYNGTVSLYKSETMEKVFNFSNESSKSSIHITTKADPQVYEIVCGTFNGLVEVYYVNSRVQSPFNTLVASNNKLSDTVTSVTVDDTCKVIASGGYDKIITLYQNVEMLDEELMDSKSRKRPLDETSTLSQLGSLEHHTKTITKLKYFPGKNEKLLSSSIDGKLCVWDIEKRSLVSSNNTGNPITCFDISPNGTMVCTGNNLGSLSIWDLNSDNTEVKLNSGQESYNFTKVSQSKNFERLVSDVSWNPTNNLISSISLDGSVILLDVRSPKFPLQTVKCKNEEEYDRGTCTKWTSSKDIIYTTASGLVNKLSYKEI